jgi:ABC-type hemin transport system ATPase subunit
VIPQTNDLSRVVNGKILVNDISIQVQRGEVVAVADPSGARMAGHAMATEAGRLRAIGPVQEVIHAC